MKSRVKRWLAAATVAVTAVTMSPLAHADKEWQSLPGETIFAMRVPDGQAFIERLRKDTKCGQVMFSDERLAKYAKVMQAGDAEGMEEFKAGLEKHGLKTEDLVKMFAGDAGLAAVMDKAPVDGEDPQMVIIAYSNPGAELATKLMKAMETGISETMEKEKDDEDASKTKRVDEEIAGIKTIHLTKTEEVTESDFSFENGEFKQVEKKFQTVTHMLFAQDKGRLLIVGSSPFKLGEGEVAPEDVEKKVKGYFARFATGESKGFNKKVAASKGLNAAMPGGDGMAEMYFDAGQMMKAVKENMPEDEETEKAFKAMDVDNLGMMALRMSLKNDQMWAGFFAETPRERKGVMSILFDQKPVAPTIPAWVPAGAIQYAHFGFDLGEAYTKTKQLVIDIQGQEAGGMFQMAEGQVQMFAGAPLPAVLSSLGNKHAIAMFAPPPGAAAAIEEGELDDAPIDRLAVVWELKDEKIWTQLFAAMNQMMAGNPNSPMKSVKEQGFTGFRMTDAPTETGVFVGKKHMVMAVGEGISSQALSAVAKAPAGKEAFKNADFVKKANSILKPRPSMMYGVVDMERQIQAQHAMIIALMKQVMLDEGAEQEIVDMLMDAIPTAKELEGAFGTNTGQLYTDKTGVVYQAVFELPKK